MINPITTLPGERVDELKALRLELQRHHSEIAVPPGFTPRTDDEAWDGWRASTLALLRGDAELFVRAAAADRPFDGLALVRMLPSAGTHRPILRAEGVHAEPFTTLLQPL